VPISSGPTPGYSIFIIYIMINSTRFSVAPSGISADFRNAIIVHVIISIYRYIRYDCILNRVPRSGNDG